MAAADALRVARVLALCCALLLLALWSRPAHAERLQVNDPFIEIRTGPGRGYPIFHVAARDEWVEVELRYTDWYKVRTESGREGWVHRLQLESTLTAAGGRTTLRDVVLDDYLQRRAEFGASWGLFESETMLKLWAAYRLSDILAVEASIGQVQGVYSGTELWQLGLTAEPFADRRLSPFFGIGFGRFSNVPNASLVDNTTTDANLAYAVIGLRYYLTRRFVARLDYTLYTAFLSDSNTGEYGAFTAGLSFFF
jgi:uncharacterized protein YgiM (DUF1202 family)